MTVRLWTRVGLLLAFEGLLILFAIGLAAYLRLGDLVWYVVVNEHGGFKALLLAGVTLVCLYYADLYDLRTVSDSRELFTRMLQALGAASLILGAVYFWFPGAIIGRGVFLIGAPLVIVFIGGWRLAFNWVGATLAPTQRLLIVGTGAGAVALARELFERRQELGVKIVGFVDPDQAKVGQAILNPGVVGTVEDIPSIVRSMSVDRVVVSLADARGKLRMDKLLEMKLGLGVAFDHLATVYEEYTGKIALENLRPSWLIFSEGFRKTPGLLAGKRAIDVTFSTIGLILLSPLMLLVAALVKLTSVGPVFYHQTRVGHQGRPFVVHKFRSMRTDAEADTGAVWARGQRRARHAHRWLSPTHPARRAAAAVERARRRHEPGWPAAGAPGVRRGPQPDDSVLRPSPRRAARGDRVGAGAVHLRRQRRGCDGEASVRSLLYEAPLDHIRPAHPFPHGENRPDGPGREVTPIVNAMTVDVEDYFHVSVFDGIVPRDQWDKLESRVSANTERLLGLFSERGVTATFFVLGWVAERFPQLVSRIAALGHEVASHGYGHRLIYEQTRDAFREDVRRAKDLLENAHGTARRWLSSAELFDYGAVAVGARRAPGRRTSLRRQHLPDSSRPLRHPKLATASACSAAAEWRARRGAGIDGANRGDEPSGRRRWLLPNPAVRVDTVGHPPAERGRAASCHLLSAPVGNQSIAASASGRLPGPVPALPQPRQD